MAIFFVDTWQIMTQNMEIQYLLWSNPIKTKNVLIGINWSIIHQFTDWHPSPNGDFTCLAILIYILMLIEDGKDGGFWFFFFIWVLQTLIEYPLNSMTVIDISFHVFENGREIQFEVEWFPEHSVKLFQSIERTEGLLWCNIS